MRGVIVLVFCCLLYINTFAKKVIVEVEIIEPPQGYNIVKFSYPKTYALDTFNRANFEAILDKRNRVKFEFELNEPRPAEITYHIGEGFFGKMYLINEIFIEPGDNIFLQISRAGIQKIHGNTSAKFNNYFLKEFNSDFRTITSYKISNRPLILIDEIIKKCDSFDIEFKCKFEENKDRLSPALQFFIKNKYNYYVGYCKLDYPTEVKFRTEQEAVLPANYYDFVGKMNVKNDSALFIPEYLWYLSQYLSHKAPKQLPYGNPVINNFELTNNYLSGKTRDVKLTSDFIYSIDGVSFKEAEKKLFDLNQMVDDKDLIAFAEQQFHSKRILSEGDMAPDFKLKDINGSYVSLDDFRGKLCT